MVSLAIPDIDFSKISPPTEWTSSDYVAHNRKLLELKAKEFPVEDRPFCPKCNKQLWPKCSKCGGPMCGTTDFVGKLELFTCCYSKTKCIECQKLPDGDCQSNYLSKPPSWETL